MMDAVALPLSSWESFYVIVGSSGAALTGLQFVVIALVADSQRRASFAESMRSAHRLSSTSAPR